MTQVTSGLRRVFSDPRIYDRFQAMMGAARVRKELVSEFIRPRAGMRLLDIGCGTAEILAFLPEDIEYWGFDISARYVKAAKGRFGSHANFHCGHLDIAQVDALPRFDVVIALGVLHHLDDGEACGLFDLAKRALHSSGRVVTVDPCLVKGQNPIGRFLIQRDRGQNVRTAEDYLALPNSAFDKVSGQVRHRSWIPYTHWIMECA